jgi:phospholipid/cholesterol/gamma-HCH transport system substrate-binding protein
MDHRIPKIGAVISVLLAIGALITFVFLNRAFQGPDPTRALGDPYELTAKFANTKTLPTKQPVLHRGISVGTVNKVDWDPVEQVGVVTFTLDEEFPIYEDAVLKIGEKSLLGDPYLNVVSRGDEALAQLEPGDEVVNTLPSVNFDEVLDFLDAEGRDRVSSLIDTIADGISRPGNGERLNGTLGGVERTLTELHTLTSTLEGQEEDLAELVRTAAIVLSEIGSREDSVRELVSSGRITLDALASNTDSLDQALTELPLLLEEGRDTLAEADPLIGEAAPVVADLRDLLPDLTAAFESGAPFTQTQLERDLIPTIEGLEPLRITATEVLPDLLTLLGKLEPLVHAVGPTARNLVPALDYLAPRVGAIAGLYALAGAAASHTDAVGHYARFAFIIEGGEFLDNPTNANCDPATQNLEPNAGFCSNAYPLPGDAADPQPFIPPYPKLIPFDPPPRSTYVD